MEPTHKQCRSCQADIPVDAAFCPTCGQASGNSELGSTEVPQTCVACGRSIPFDSAYCMYCGRKQIEDVEPINTNPPAYIANAQLWLIGPRIVKDGGFFGTTQVGRWITFQVSLRDNQDRPTASNGELVIAVVKRGHSLVQELSAERLLSEFESKTYFTHHYPVRVDDFKVIDGVLCVGLKYTSETVFCEQTLQSSPLFFHCLFKPDGGDWLVWRPSMPSSRFEAFPRTIHWD